MTSNGEVQNVPTTGWAISAGVAQLLLAAGGGALWLLSGFGVAMCGDSGNVSYCDSLSTKWSALAVLAGINACTAMVLLITAGSPERGVRRAGGLVAGAAAAALVFYGLYFLGVAGAPVPRSG